jgi:hypothetical protein
MSKAFILLQSVPTTADIADWIAGALLRDRLPIGQLVVNEVLDGLPGLPLKSSPATPDDVRSPWADSGVQTTPDLPQASMPLTAILELWPLADRTAGACFETVRQRLLDRGARVMGGYEVDERVQVPYSRYWPDGETSPGPKILWFTWRNPEMTLDQFAERWRQHVYFVRRYQPGVWRHTQNLVQAVYGAPTCAPDGIGITHNRTVEDFTERMVDSEKGGRAVADDVLGFVATAESYLVKETILRSLTPVPC